jgi:uncharacterized protein YecT (DUF1311 family)
VEPDRRSRGGTALKGTKEDDMRTELLCAVACLVLGLAAAHAKSAKAVDCSSATTQRDMNSCFDRERQAVDQELNRTYHDAMERASRPNIKASLGDAEAAWSIYRDKQCEFESSGVRGGSVYATIVALCLTKATRARIEDLRRFLKCEEGDLSCPL